MCNPVIDDGGWAQVTVRELNPLDTCTVLGRELTVGFCIPARCGGDFYVLEAYGDSMQDIISCTLDKNTPIWARRSQ